MKNFTPDSLSLWIGRFEQDCYLIGRGVRLLGSHTIKQEDYKIIKDLIKNTASQQGVELSISKDGNIVDVIIFHPTKGRVWLENLNNLDKKIEQFTDNSKYEKIFQKIISKKELTFKENARLKKLKNFNIEAEKEYGKIFGYTESSISRHLENKTKASVPI